MAFAFEGTVLVGTTVVVEAVRLETLVEKAVLVGAVLLESAAAELAVPEAAATAGLADEEQGGSLDQSTECHRSVLRHTIRRLSCPDSTWLAATGTKALSRAVEAVANQLLAVVSVALATASDCCCCCCAESAFPPFLLLVLHVLKLLRLLSLRQL